MDGADELIGLAEFALALGGFGVLAHAVSARGQEIQPYRFVLLRAMLLNTLGVGLIVLVPVVLARWGFSPAAAIRVGSGALAMLIATIAVSLRRGTERTNPQRQYLAGAWPVRIAWTAGLVAFVTCVTTAANWPWRASLGAFEFAILLALSVAVYQFMALVFGAGQSPAA